MNIMKWLTTFSLLLIFACQSEAEDVRKTLRYGGTERSYYVHLPPGFDQKKSLPLLILLHGGGGGAQQALKNYPLAPVADREGFLLVAPNGSGPFPRRELLRTWNVGWGFGYAQQNHTDDVGFLRALIGQLKNDYTIDSKRVYLTGLSNGAILCHYAGAANSDLLAGIAPVVGCAGGGETADLTYPTAPTHPLNVIMFNGELDQHVPLQGGKQKLHTEKQARYVCSARQSAEFWVKSNGCNSEPKIEQLSDQKATRYTWSGGKQNTRVVLWVLHNQGHAWPGGTAPRAVADQPTTLVKAHEELWKFWSPHAAEGGTR
jgi:polyhydroxybutyrate depolymerase